MSETTTQIRWLLRRDLPDVLMIERASFPNPWTKAEILGLLRERTVIGMVAEQHGVIVGFMFYELLEGRCGLLNIAVLPDCRRMGIGRAMIERLMGRLRLQNRNRISLKVTETNLSGQLFFRAVGFRAELVLHDCWDGSDEDAYMMVRRLMDSPVMAGGDENAS